jgi:hypothetical protein
MRIGLVIATNKPELVGAAFRYGVEALDNKNLVKVFVLNRDFEDAIVPDDEFDLGMDEYEFVDKGGAILDCDKCLEIRRKGGAGICPSCTSPDIVDFTADSDRVLTFG